MFLDFWAFERDWLVGQEFGCSKNGRLKAKKFGNICGGSGQKVCRSFISQINDYL